MLSIILCTYVICALKRIPQTEVFNSFFVLQSKFIIFSNRIRNAKTNIFFLEIKQKLSELNDPPIRRAAGKNRR